MEYFDLQSVTGVYVEDWDSQSEHGEDDDDGGDNTLSSRAPSFVPKQPTTGPASSDNVMRNKNIECAACGRKGHIVTRYTIVCEHKHEFTDRCGYDGRHAWILEPGNSDKAKALVKQIQW